MNRRQAARARRYAIAVITWRRTGRRAASLGLPVRYRGDMRWVVHHLIQPASRVALRAQSRRDLGRAS